MTLWVLGARGQSSPSFSALVIKKPKTFIDRINNIGESGSLCLSPLSGEI
jgi:hypothetical protein